MIDVSKNVFLATYEVYEARAKASAGNRAISVAAVQRAVQHGVLAGFRIIVNYSVFQLPPDKFGKYASRCVAKVRPVTKSI